MADVASLPTDPFGCMACGACCEYSLLPGEPPDAYVALDPADIEVLDRSFPGQDLVRREAGQAYLAARPVERISMRSCDAHGTASCLETRARCVFLEGEIGRDAHCRAYELRPVICRRFTPGTEACRSMRVDAGLRIGGAFLAARRRAAADAVRDGKQITEVARMYGLNESEIERTAAAEKPGSMP
jgi:Fe-S-cluster containining protein